MYTIRNIIETDNKEIASLIRDVFEEFDIALPGTVYTDPTTDALFELFQHPASSYFIALYKDEIVGGCGLYPTPGLPLEYAELVKFYIHPLHRGHGLGFLLMEKVFKAAIQLDYNHLYLESFPSLSKAISLYIRAGFKTIDKPLGNSGHFACTIYMEKDLAHD